MTTTRGIPNFGGGGGDFPDIAPLNVKKIKAASLDRISAYTQLRTRTNDKTGETREVLTPMLSLDWNSGHYQKDVDGNPIVDQDGNERIHYINDGFVNFSGHNKANFVKIIKALGLDRFLDAEGNIRDDIARDIEVEFGTNKLGEKCSGYGWQDLPTWTEPAKGGTQRKRDVEVPISSFKIGGVELIGRKVELRLTIKGNYNKIETYLEIEEEDEPASPTATRGVPKAEEFDPFATGDKEVQHTELPMPAGKDPKSVGTRYVNKIMKEAGVGPSHLVPVLLQVASLSVDEESGEVFDVNTVPRPIIYNDIPLELAQAFRQAIAQHGSDIVLQARESLHKTEEADTPPWDEDDDDAF